MRMRTIKPSFFRNEDLLETEPLARLLFAGLWCAADRNGRLEDRPKRLKMDLLPADNCEVEDLLEQLVRAGMIVRYQVEGRRYIQVLTFLRHNRPHYKEAPSRIPPPEGIAVTSEECGSSDDWGENPGPDQGEPARDLGSGILDQGSGEGDPGSSRERAPDPPPPFELTLETPAGSAAGPEEPDAEAQPEQGPEEVAAGPAVEANGWRFDVEDLAVLEDAVGDMPIEPQDLPGVIGQRLRKRASPMREGGPSWPVSVPDRWDALPGAEVAAWSAAAMAIARRKAGVDRSSLLDLAAGAVGRDLLTGTDLPEVERRRRGVTVTGGGAPPPPPADTAGWRSWLGQQGGMGHEAFVVSVAKSFRSRAIDPGRYLALYLAALEAAREEAGGAPPPPEEELCRQRARDFALQELWDELGEIKGAAGG